MLHYFLEGNMIFGKNLGEMLRGEFIDIIEFLDESQNTIVHRFERYNNEIKNGAKLIVRESQSAVFVKEGQVADVFGPGHYELNTNNMPIMSTLLGWKHDFESPFKSEVYFVNTKLFTNQKWGTQNPIPLRDADFGVIRIRARGNYNFRVSDPKQFIKDISGTNSHFKTENMEDELRAQVISQFTDALAELKLPALDLAAQYNELGSTIEKFVNERFAQYGLALQQFLIENISFPPEVEAAMDKRAQMGVLGNMDQFMKFQTANAVENASKNPGEVGGMMGAGMGMGMGMNMAQQMAGMAAQQAPQAAPAVGAAPPPPPPAAGYHIAVNGQQSGPFDMNTLTGMISSGQISRETMVWKAGMAGWAKAGDQPDLAGLFGAVPPPPPPM